MPTRVHIPTRIRVDSSALRDRMPELREALVAAATRALTNSCDVALASAGPHARITIMAPTLTWTGDDADNVPGEQRTCLEDLVWSALTEAVEASPLADYLGAEENAPERPAAKVCERIDEQRFVPLLDRYLIPTYEEGGNLEAVAVSPESQPPQSTTTAEPQSVWRVIQSEEDFWEAVTEVLKRPDAARIASLGHPLLGALFANVDGQVCIRVTDLVRPEDLLIDCIQIQGLRWVGQSRRGRLEWQPVELPPDARYRLRYFAAGATREQRVEVLRRHFAGHIQRLLSEHLESLRRIMTQAELEQAIEDEITRMTNNAADRLSETRCFLMLNVNGEDSLIPCTRTMAQDLDLELLPLTMQTGVAGRRGRAGVEGRTEGAEGGGDEGGQAAESIEPPQPMSYPLSSYTTSGEQDCSALLGEPPLEELGADGLMLQRLIAEIARMLNIPVCRHAARFCLNAAQAMGSRAAGIGEHAASHRESGFLRPASAGTGNLGALDFRAVASPAVTYMRFLAGVTPYISQLSDMVCGVYAKPEHRPRFQGTWRDDPAGWNLHFLIALESPFRQSIAWIFGRTCQVLLLQLLRSSHEQIAARRGSIDSYASRFETYIVPHLRRLDELLSLRERLIQSQRIHSVGRLLERAGASPGLRDLPAGAVSWRAAAQEVIEAITASRQAPAGQPGRRGEITIGDDHQVRIWDSRGRLWDLEALERAIVIRRGLVESFDPLIKQMTDLPEVMRQFEAAANLRGELERILGEMADHNEEFTRKVEDSWVFAFRASRIREDLQGSSIPGTTFALRGIHSATHEQIGEFFRGDRHYALGVNALFGRELAIENLTDFFEFTGLLLLAVLCPPAAFVAGAATSLYQYSQALERERLYGALMDPDLLLSRAEVETELFAARLGVALSFIPEIGSLLGRGVAIGVRLGVRGSARAVRSSARQLAQGGARGLGRAALRPFTRAMARQLEQGLVRAFVEELASDQFMDMIITRLMEPVMQRVEREVAVTGAQGGAAGAQRSLSRLRRERQATIRQQGRSTEGARATPNR